MEVVHVHGLDINSRLEKLRARLTRQLTADAAAVGIARAIEQARQTLRRRLHYLGFDTKIEGPEVMVDFWTDEDFFVLDSVGFDAIASAFNFFEAGDWCFCSRFGSTSIFIGISHESEDQK